MLESPVAEGIRDWRGLTGWALLERNDIGAFATSVTSHALRWSTKEGKSTDD